MSWTTRRATRRPGWLDLLSPLTQYYLDFLRSRGLVDLYQKVAVEAIAKFPESRAVASHFVGALLRKKDYKGGW